MPQVVRRDQAKADILELFVRVGRRSIRAAEELRDEIDDECELLARFPRLGRERPDLAPGLYSRPVAGRVIVYYYVSDDGIEVARVLHARRRVTPSMF